jgi:uncharacterized protein YegP (UPF0339 family)
MGKFYCKKTATGYNFRLTAANGETIGTSEVYSSEQSCHNGIDSVKRNALSVVEDQTADPVVTEKNPKYEIYRDKSGEFRFRLKATNGEPILASEGYASKDSCKNGIESVKKNAPDAPIVDED